MASDLIPGGLNMKLLSNFLVPIFTSFAGGMQNAAYDEDDCM